MSQNFCFVCYGTSLVVSDGLIICNDCGTQSQVRRRAPAAAPACRPWPSTCSSALQPLEPPRPPHRRLTAALTPAPWQAVIEEQENMETGAQQRTWRTAAGAGRRPAGAAHVAPGPASPPQARWAPGGPGLAQGSSAAAAAGARRDPARLPAALPQAAPWAT
jgi:hypothetical protein